MTEKNTVDLRDYASEIGTTPVSLSVAKLVVQLCWHDNHVPLLIGESGTGKTAGIQQLADMNNMELIPYHLGSMDSTDVRGPMFPQEGGTFKFLTPGNIPIKWKPSLRQKRVLHQLKTRHGISVEDISADNFDATDFEELTEKDLDVIYSIRRDIEKEAKKAAMFFDEGNRGQRDVMNAAMPVWTEGLLGDAEIGPNVRLCAAMNPPGGKYAVNTQFSQDPAMRRRTCQVVVNFSVAEFLNYAEDPEKQSKTDLIPPIDYEEYQERDKYRPYHYAVVSFIRQNPKRALDVQSREAGKVYGCPPTWEAVSDTMYTLERLEIELNDSRIRQAVRAKISGHVGSSAADEFLDHFEKATESVEPLELLYEYKEGTSTYAKVQRKLGKGEHLGLLNVIKAAIEYVFDPQDEDFEYAEVTPQIAKLLNDMPPNTAQDAMTYFAKASDEIHGGFGSHLRDMTKLLSQEEDFKEFQRRSVSTTKKYAESQAEEKTGGA